MRRLQEEEIGLRRISRRKLLHLHLLLRISRRRLQRLTLVLRRRRLRSVAGGRRRRHARALLACGGGASRGRSGTRVQSKVHSLANLAAARATCQPAAAARRSQGRPPRSLTPRRKKRRAGYTRGQTGHPAHGRLPARVRGRRAVVEDPACSSARPQGMFSFTSGRPVPRVTPTQRHPQHCHEWLPVRTGQDRRCQALTSRAPVAALATRRRA